MGEAPAAFYSDTFSTARKASWGMSVVREGQAIGIVSIGDLARYRDPESALAQISSAAPNN